MRSAFPWSMRRADGQRRPNVLSGRGRRGGHLCDNHASGLPCLVQRDVADRGCPGPEQINSTDFAWGTANVCTSGNVFYHGGGLGLECRF